MAMTTGYPSSAPSAPLRSGYGAGYGAPSASAYASSAARYREAELLSASPGQLVVMLYDKMLLTLRRARAANDARQVAQRVDEICKATDMITELRISLDHEQGGQISAQLDALYAFMLRELLEANRKQDSARIDVVLKIATDLRDGFAQIVAGQAAATASAAAAPAVSGGLAARVG